MQAVWSQMVSSAKGSISHTIALNFQNFLYSILICLSLKDKKIKPRRKFQPWYRRLQKIITPAWYKQTGSCQRWSRDVSDNFSRRIHLCKWISQHTMNWITYVLNVVNGKRWALLARGKLKQLCIQRKNLKISIFVWVWYFILSKVCFFHWLVILHCLI